MANKFVSLLESIGSKFKLGYEKAIAIESKLLPVEKAIAGVVQVIEPAAGTTLSDLVGVIGNVEQVATAVGASTGTGAQKLAAALPGVEQAILADPLFAGKTIPDLTVYNTALTNFTSALADLTDSFAASTPTVSLTPTTATPAPAPAAAVAVKPAGNA